MLFNESELYHIGIKKSDGAAYAIVCGDPARVEKIARLMDNPALLASRREYTSWTASLASERILIMSHGIGGPSAAICVEELAMAGVKTIIRVGTCGGMHLDVKAGDIVIASAAVRAEGTTREYLPIEFPAAADFDVTLALRSAAQSENRHPAHVGIVHCKDSFYGQHSPSRMPIADELESKWKAWLRGGCLASEMESATIFCVSQALGIRAGCILRAVWNQERVNAGYTDPSDDDTLSAARIAIAAAKRLILNQL